MTAPAPGGEGPLGVVGGSVRALASSAARAGLRVKAADRFADADLLRQAPGAVTRVDDFPEGLADWLAGAGVSRWVYTGGLENQPELVDRMARIAPLAGCAGQALRRSRDPMALAASAAAYGVAWPATQTLAEARRRPGPWLAKTYRHSAGAGVWRLDDDQSWREAARQRAVAQQWLPGEPRAAVLLVGPRVRALVGVTRQLVGDAASGAHPFGYGGSIGPIPIDRGERAELAAWAHWLADGLGLCGVVGVDYLAAKRPIVVEINPRWTASVEVLERAAGASLLPAHLAACAGESPDLAALQGARGAVGKLVLYADRAARCGAALHEWAMSECDAGQAADVPHPGDAFEPGWPVLTLLASAADAESAHAELAERARGARGRIVGVDAGASR